MTMTNKSDVDRLALGQPRTAFWILALLNLGFAALLIIPEGEWAWERILLLCVDIGIATWAVRKATQIVKLGPDGVKVVNMLSTHRVKWGDIKRFTLRASRRSNLSGDPVMELANGTIVPLSSLVPWYGARSADVDVATTIRDLNRRLDRQRRERSAR